MPQPAVSIQNPSVPVFYEGQDCNGVPDHYVYRERAIQLKESGEASSCNRGKAIMIKRPKPEGRVDTHRHSVKSRWAVVGQTKKPFSDKHSLGTLDMQLSTEDKPVYRKPFPGPGCPRYALV